MILLAGNGYCRIPSVRDTDDDPWQASDGTGPIIVQLSDNRRRGTQLQCRVINVGSRGTDWFKELGHEMEVIFGSVQKLIVPSNLARAASASDDYTANRV